METDIQSEILKLNKVQASFYNTPNPERNFTIAMKTWRVVRRRMYYLMENTDVWNDVYKLQKAWMGDLAGKKVLDFGCYAGNALSTYLANNAESYIGIDLSEEGLQSLAKNFEKRHINNAHLECVDILSGEFKESGFDIIYAQGVLHHFNPIDILLPVLFKKLAPGGRIVSLDPMQTSVLTKCVRAIYHPFRSDKEWEWPFKREIFPKFKKYFNIIGIQGLMGYSKWSIPIVFFNKDTAVNIFERLHDKDMAFAKGENRHLWGCMQLAMCLEKKSNGIEAANTAV